MNTPIEPYSDLSALSRALAKTREKRILQKQLSHRSEIRRITLNKILSHLSHEAIASLAGCSLTWYWVEDLGGMLVLSGYEVPAIASQQSLLDEFLGIVLSVTGVTMASITGQSSYPLHCQWDGSMWGCRVKVKPGHFWESAS